MNSKDGGATIRNNIQFPISFENFETQKIYLIVKSKKETAAKAKDAVVQAQLGLESQEHVDRSQAGESNFEQVTPGASLKYGSKELIFLGLAQQKAASADHSSRKASGKPKQEDGRETACLFKFKDHTQGLSQTFTMIPRFY